MEDIINLFDAETVWKCINNEGQPEVSKRQEYYLECAKEFGILCMLATPQTEELKNEFITAYNEISKEIIRRLEAKEKPIFKDLGKSIEEQGTMNDTIKNICYEDMTKINEKLTMERKIWVLSNYGACLNALKNAYDINRLYDFFTKKSEKHI